MMSQPFSVKPNKRISTILALPLIWVVRAYQVVLSPHVGHACRFHPSCSHYAIEALQRHGVIDGTVLAMKRVWRCRPWGAMGIDPVPDQIQQGNR